MDALRVALEHLVDRHDVDLGMLAAEQWTLRSMPTMDDRERLAVLFAAAAAEGWPVAPGKPGWIPPGGRPWVEKLRTRYEEAVAPYVVDGREDPPAAAQSTPRADADEEAPEAAPGYSDDELQALSDAERAAL